MFNMDTIVRCLLFVFVTKEVICGPYANSYPYKLYGYSYTGGNSGIDSEDSVNAAGFIKNRVSDQGNDLKSLQDYGKFINTENASKGHDLAHIKQGTSTDTHKQTTGENFETDKSHNRKHIKSGFHNSYSKEENGNNSSYYENSDDRGGKLVYNKQHGTRGDAYDSKFNEGVRDGSVKEQLDDRQAGYDTRGSHDRQHLVAEDQGNRHGHRDGYSRDQGERFETYNDGRRYQPRYNSENSYRRDSVPDRFPRLEYSDYRDSGLNNGPSSRIPLELPLNLPPISSLNKGQDDGYFSRQRITIYDDPRELIEPRTDNRRGDYAVDGLYSPRLDIRPSPLRFRNYDDENRNNMRYRDY